MIFFGEQSGKTMDTHYRKDGRESNAVWSDDGKYFAIIYTNWEGKDFLKIINYETKTEIKTQTLGRFLDHVHWNINLRLFMTPGGGYYDLWDPETGLKMGTLDTKGYFSKISWSQNKSQFAWIRGNTFGVYDINRGDIFSVRSGKDSYRDVFWMPIKNQILIAFYNGYRLFDGRTLEFVGSYPMSSRHNKILEDEETFVSISTNNVGPKELIISDLQNQMTKNISLNEKQIIDFQVSNDENFVAISFRNVIEVYDLENLEIVNIFTNFMEHSLYDLNELT